MNKTVTLTETELKHMIQSVIREELQRYLITEMAYSLKTFKNCADNIIPQIVENWCLVRYCTLSGDKQNLKNHWMKELAAHMNNIRQMKLKTSNNKNTKANALFSLWNRRDIDTDEGTIHSHIAFKFQEENIPTEGDIYAQVIQDFKNATTDIVNVLTEDSPAKILNYVKTI